MFTIVYAIAISAFDASDRKLIALGKTLGQRLLPWIAYVVWHDQLVKENKRRNISHHRLTRNTPSRFTWESIRLSKAAELAGSTRWSYGLTAE